ncbi:MAG TPA: SDR family NAD(P)-dependent oxidoreductase, partial [Candidatus Kapabacteria bacterium]|nr:SDR family NAD(P)-dependent oxidoreductase [Candidatus Kapabacteria bacterium]
MNNKIVVITGSTRGIGYGLADAFLAQGCSVIVSGRAQEGVDRARAELSKRHEPAKIAGLACDV